MWFASGGSGQVELETSLQKAGEEKQELDRQLAGLNAAAWLQVTKRAERRVRSKTCS